MRLEAAPPEIRESISTQSDLRTLRRWRHQATDNATLAASRAGCFVHGPLLGLGGYRERLRPNVDQKPAHPTHRKGPSAYFSLCRISCEKLFLNEIRNHNVSVWLASMRGPVSQFASLTCLTRRFENPQRVFVVLFETQLPKCEELQPEGQFRIGFGVGQRQQNGQRISRSFAGTQKDTTRLGE